MLKYTNTIVIFIVKFTWIKLVSNPMCQCDYKMHINIDYVMTMIAAMFSIWRRKLN